MSKHKILNVERIAQELRMARMFNTPILLATGCFDILHRGHVQLLEDARDSFPGHPVWVGLNSDRAVRELKGDGRPIHDFASRAVVMAALESVHHVFEIDDVRVDDAIRLIQPRVWIKGGSYTIDTLDKSEVAAAKEVGAKIEILPLLAGYSTTLIIERMNASKS